MNNKYKKLFETVTLPNGVSLRNRFVLAPLTHTSQMMMVLFQMSKFLTLRNVPKM